MKMETIIEMRVPEGGGAQRVQFAARYNNNCYSSKPCGGNCRAPLPNLYTYAMFAGLRESRTFFFLFRFKLLHCCCHSFQLLLALSVMMVFGVFFCSFLEIEIYVQIMLID